MTIHDHVMDRAWLGVGGRNANSQIGKDFFDKFVLQLALVASVALSTWFLSARTPDIPRAVERVLTGKCANKQRYL